jgi:CxxC-x17-CxxC domain-containing protein
MSFMDRNLSCRDCGVSFVFTAGEQAFYQQKGFQNEPTRCPSCRRQKKDMGGGAGGGGRGGAEFGGRGGGGGGGGNRMLYKAVCSACGAETQVPFAPSGDRPVYCRNCYNSRRGVV